MLLCSISSKALKYSGESLNSSLDLNFLFSAGPVNSSKISFISLFSSVLENLVLISSSVTFLAASIVSLDNSPLPISFW